MLPVRAFPFGILAARPTDVRLSWTSRSAQQRWEPRFSRIRDALLRSELVRLAEGKTAAALAECAYEDLRTLLGAVAEGGLVGIPLSARLLLSHVVQYRQDAPVEEYLSHTFLLCRPERAVEVAAAAAAERPNYEVAGVPACCADAASRPGDGTRRPSAAPGNEFEGDAGLATAGLSAVCHTACSPQCKETAALARSRIATARRLGRAEEMDWLEELLKLPSRTSEVNGIAETVTPLFRMVASCVGDRANAHREPGRTGPPLDPPPRQRPVSARPADDAQPSCEPWLRRGRLALIASEQISAIRAAVGSALDVPCGDGLLLEFVRLENNRLGCNGLDPDARDVAAARERHTACDARFEVAYTAEALEALNSAIAPVGVLFFSLEALSRLSDDDRLALLKRMESISPVLIAYSLAEMPGSGGLSEALLASLGLASCSPATSGAVSARVRLAS